MEAKLSKKEECFYYLVPYFSSLQKFTILLAISSHGVMAAAGYFYTN
jgi:hypothetical protein